MTRKTLSANYVGKHESVFSCPICKSSMKVIGDRSLICSKKHTFDFTKQGYVNLLSRAIKTKYNNELFEARRKLITEDGFFEPLCQAIAKVLLQSYVPDEQIYILDTGCGEGSHLSMICNIVSSQSDINIIGTGIDIAKEGIALAARNYSNHIWVVADLAQLPFQDHQFDILLNILTPSNYAEFNRLLKQDGLLIKVVPGSDYLIELREALYDDFSKHKYSNDEIVHRFEESFHTVSRTSLRYTMRLTRSSLQSLMQMTPLAWTVTEQRKNAFLKKDSALITVDLEILVAKKINKYVQRRLK